MDGTDTHPDMCCVNGDGTVLDHSVVDDYPPSILRYVHELYNLIVIVLRIARLTGSACADIMAVALYSSAHFGW